MPWVTVDLGAYGGKQRFWVDDTQYSGTGGTASYTTPTLVVTPTVSIVNQQVTVTWTITDTNGGSGYYQTAANVSIKDPTNLTVVSVDVTTPQTATLTVPEGTGYYARVNVEAYYYFVYYGAGSSSTFSVGPPPPPPPPPTPPFVPYVGMMGI